MSKGERVAVAIFVSVVLLICFWIIERASSGG